MEKCTRCASVLKEWNIYEDGKLKHGTVWGILCTILSSSPSANRAFSLFHSSDKKSFELFFCQNCKKYYLKCSVCGELIETNRMPEQAYTVLKCQYCHKRIRYDDNLWK